MKRSELRIAAACLAVLLILIPLAVFAEGEEPAISVSTATAYAGNTETLTVSAQNLTEQTILEYTLRYDKDLLTLNSATVSDGLGVEVPYVDTDTAGEIHVFLLHDTGLTGDLTLMSLSFTVSETAEAGMIPVTVTVGDAYNNAGEVVTFQKNHGGITVQTKAPTTPTIYLYNTYSKTAAQMGDTLTLTICNYKYIVSTLAAGTITVEYDGDLLQCTDVALSGGMAKESCVTDFNVTKGRARLVFACPEALGTGQYAVLTFTVVGDADTTTQINVTSSNLYAADRTVINGDQKAQNIKLTKLPVVPDYPDFYIEFPDCVAVGDEFEAQVILEGGSNLGAGDFVITYDTADLACTEKPAGTHATVNKNYQNGTISFSVVDQSGINEDTAVLTIPFRALDGSHETTLTTGGKYLIDADWTHDVLLDYPENALTIHNRVIDPAVLSSAVTGSLSEGAHCSVCGKVLQEQEALPRLGDIDQDGDITAIDANYARRNAVEMVQLSDLQKLIGDVNGDNEVDAMDAYAIRCYSVEIIQKFSIEE